MEKNKPGDNSKNRTYLTYPSDKQKRKNARIIVEIEGLIVISGNKPIPCRIISLGTGGLTINLTTALYQGESIQVSFFLNENHVSLNCEVARVLGKECGLKYLDVDEKSINTIQSFIYRDTFL